MPRAIDRGEETYISAPVPQITLRVDKTRSLSEQKFFRNISHLLYRMDIAISIPISHKCICNPGNDALLPRNVSRRINSPLLSMKPPVINPRYPVL